jgi:hypothetical protein
MRPASAEDHPGPAPKGLPPRATVHKAVIKSFGGAELAQGLSINRFVVETIENTNPAPEESSTKILVHRRKCQEPMDAGHRTTECEDESDESDGNLRFGGNSFGYWHGGMQGPCR